MSIPTLGQWYKWYKMLTGKSIQHVPQGEGRVYSKTSLRGYYNDLTNKFLGVTGATQALDEQGIPIHRLANGQRVYFPTAVAQYGLGAYDVWLLKGDRKAYNAFLRCADWLLKDQDRMGGWSVWPRAGIAKGCPYSAMTQGEGASLLYRAGLETGEIRFNKAADMAIGLMLKPINEGGTANYEQEKLVLEECPHITPSAILNGWIFAIFGLYDGVLVTKRADWGQALQKTIDTLEIELHCYDAGYWSYYDRAGHLASPFYHDLHINLLRVLAKLAGREAFLLMAERWDRYRENNIYYVRAFLTKAYQKLKDPGEVVFVK
ncbi:D-glucuronyl C5-epimerase family protein [Acetomicrobium sp.]|uniref:D-glucuronyl C5-epimerase family protein n=1 Tax=Acetomicrobium sp. TaxID=1872099 RepID=UPI002B262F68|nr:D-glucuronyl C5-epimerase family protein [Acetomicrobium sp.]